MTDTPASDTLVERLKQHGTWTYPPHDPGNYTPEKGTFTPDALALEAAARLTAMRAELEAKDKDIAKLERKVQAFRDDGLVQAAIARQGALQDERDEALARATRAEADKMNVPLYLGPALAAPADSAEPVAWRWHWKVASEDDGWSYRDTPPADDGFLVIQPLYLHAPDDAELLEAAEQEVKRLLASPAPASKGAIETRNDEMGFVEFINSDVPYIAREIDGHVAILLDIETRNVIGYRVYDPASKGAVNAAVREWRRVHASGEAEDIHQAMRDALTAALVPGMVQGATREAIQLAIDYLKETKQGNPARSAGHNARLVLEAALAASPALSNGERDG
jgi:hypothetical protein